MTVQGTLKIGLMALAHVANDVAAVFKAER